MVQFVFAAFVVLGLTYDEAYERSRETDQLVVVITSESCPACEALKIMLNELDIEFHETQDAKLFGIEVKNRPVLIIYKRNGDQWERNVSIGSVIPPHNFPKATARPKAVESSAETANEKRPATAREKQKSPSMFRWFD